MDILLLILSCSFFHNNMIVHSIINIQSCSNPYYICDVVKHKEYHNKDLSEAKDSFNKIITNGGKPLIGLMSVPHDLSYKYGHEPLDLLDPCINIQIGSDILSEIDNHLSKEDKNNKKILVKKYLEYLGYKNDFLIQQTNSIMANIKLIIKSKTFDELPNKSLIMDLKTRNAAEKNWSDSSIYLKEEVLESR